MVKRVAGILFFLVLSVLYGQDNQTGQSDLLPLLDGAVKNLASEINKKVSLPQGQKLALTGWTFQDTSPPLGDYWAAQLMEELVNIPGRSFTVLPGGQEGADLTLSGEIVEVAGIIRVYTRLGKARLSVEAVFHTDFVRDVNLSEMLAGGRGGSSSSTARDAYETDSRENPHTTAIASGEGGSYINRTLHTSGDEDFFLLVPDRDGSLVMETSGDIDTYLEFYEADSWNRVATDDDGGSGGNARIRHRVSSGTRYIAKVRGYSSEVTGSYGFRAYLVEEVQIAPDEYENDDDFSSAKDITLGEGQRHTFSSGDDVDWVKFQVTQSGRYTITAVGINNRSGGLDTYIELYDSSRNLIDENDDGGDHLDAKLTLTLAPGTYYLSTRCLDDEPEEPYTITVRLQPSDR
ncbi:MAG: PPC domain-containing protein [Treponema sp.]|jgi:hypothetical protein|nr:PPC domain-containing protein [Treponema sp.]